MPTQTMTRSQALEPRTAQAPTSSARAQHRRVVIVGAGIGGLELSRRLQAEQVQHVVFEQAEQPGGAIRTVERAGDVLEAGPQRTRLTPMVSQLVRELGIEGELVLAPVDLPLFIYRTGRLRLAPLSAAQLLRTDLFSFSAKLRLLGEPLTERARAGETVADYFVRRFGRAAYEDLLGPLFGGLYASDPAAMLVRHALMPALLEMGAERSAVLALLGRGFMNNAIRACSFKRGMRTLTDALHEHVRDHVHLATRVFGIERDGAGYRVITTHDAISATDVVLTCTAGEAALLLGDLAPAPAARLAQLTYNRLAIVHLRSDARLHGSGYQVSFAEPLRTRGVTFNHALFRRHRIYTAFLGGALDPDLVDRTDEEIADAAADEFVRVTGHAAEPANVERASLPAWDRTWTALDGLELPTGIHLCANYESRVGIPGRLARARQLAGILSH
jgi:oxygen-dependent protoporphyrinogen oxidase